MDRCRVGEESMHAWANLKVITCTVSKQLHFAQRHLVAILLSAPYVKRPDEGRAFDIKERLFLAEAATQQLAGQTRNLVIRKVVDDDLQIVFQSEDV